MSFLRQVYLVIYVAVRFRWILFLNRKLIRELKRQSKMNPKLYIALRLSETNPRKIEYDMQYRD
jgi:hypothetical protein